MAQQDLNTGAIANDGTGDTIEVYAKGDGTNGITLTINKLDLTLSN